MPFFDTEPHTAFSGSYVDHHFSGSLIQSVTKIGSTITVVTGTRVEIGSNVSGAQHGYIQSRTDFGDYVNAVSGNFRLEKHQLRNVGLFQTNARYYDTVMPAIQDIMEADCLGVTLLNAPAGANVLTFAAVIGTTNSIDKIQYEITESAGGVPQAQQQKLSNNIWPFAYPFEYRYRNAQRPQEFASQIAQLTYVASAAFVSSAPTIPYWAGFTNERRPATNTTPNSNDIFWNGSYTQYNRQIGRFTVAYVLQSDDAAIPSTMKVMVLHSTGGFVDSNGDFNPPVLTAYDGPLLKPNEQPVDATNTDIMKHFFGFGDGVNRTVEFATTLSSSWATTNSHRIGYGSKMRGWKYGVLSAFEVNPKCIFRRDRFGQFRDMFEQRQYSRILDKETGTIFNPIEVTLISGSDLPPGVDAYATATFKPQENVGGSGIYDFYYASSRPWGKR